MTDRTAVAARRRLGAEASFWVVAAVFTVVLAGGTLPAPLYVLWEREDGFGSGTVTLVFATYAVGVLVALLLTGRLSDVLGRRALLAPALATSAASSVLFAVSGSLPFLYAGRLLSGVSVGLVTSAATAALSELDGMSREGAPGRRAAAVSTAANLGGLALGAVVAGAFAQYVGAPTVTVFVVGAVVAAVLLVGVLLVAESAPPAPETARLRPQTPSLPGEARTVFAVAGPTSFIALGVLGLFSSLAPGFVAKTLEIPSLLTGGVVAGSAFAAATVTQLALPRVAPQRGVTVGLLLMPVGLVLVVAALDVRSLALLLLGAAVGGVGVGLAFRGSLAMMSAAVPAERRAEVLTTVFVAAYLGLAVPVLGLGLATRATTTERAATGFTVALTALCLATLAVSRRATARVDGAPAR